MKLFNFTKNNNEKPSSEDLNLNQIQSQSQIQKQNQIQLIDERDGRTYKTIKIGDQIIMAENLAFRPIIGVYYTYDEKQSKVDKYGYLYDLDTAKRIGKEIKGWHLPTKEEFELLLKILGEDPKKVYEELKPGGSTGFEALSGGYLSNIGTFTAAGDRACFWSSSINNDNNYWGLICDESDNEVLLAPFEKQCGLSIRLFKDK
jgi:uncharacterized protein (TIGR02145 family)